MRTAMWEILWAAAADAHDDDVEDDDEVALDSNRNWLLQIIDGGDDKNDRLQNFSFNAQYTRVAKMCLSAVSWKRSDSIFAEL